ncbi:Hypothetical predicted protein, partial [Marmota monax]
MAIKKIKAPALVEHPPGCEDTADQPAIVIIIHDRDRPLENGATAGNGDTVREGALVDMEGRRASTRTTLEWRGEQNIKISRKGASQA